MPESPLPNTGIDNPDKPQPDPKVTMPGNGTSGNKTYSYGAEKPAVHKRAGASSGNSIQADGSPGSSVQDNLTTTWLSYCSLSDIAVTIAHNLKDHLAGNVIVSVGDSILNDLRQWLSLKSVLSNTQQYCDSVLTHYDLSAPTRTEEAGIAIQAGLAASTAALKALSGLFSLYKTKMTITQHQFELDPDAVVSAVAAQILAMKPCTIIKSPRSILTRSQPPTEGTQALVNLVTARAKAIELAVAHKDDAIARGELTTVVKLVDEIVDQFPIFGGQETAASMFNGEIIHKALSENNTLLLDLKPIIGGGDQIKIERTFFHTEILFINGVASVSYTLVDPDGKILVTDNIHGHTGYKQYQAIDGGIWKTSVPKTILED